MESQLGRMGGNMTEKELQDVIRETVAETIRNLRKSGMLKRSDDVAYSEIGGRLYDYYKDPEAFPEMAAAVHKIRNDPYFAIIPQYYGNRVSIEALAGMYGCEISTISRNKKRLALKIYLSTLE
jgi:hypothetical protein